MQQACHRLLASLLNPLRSFLFLFFAVLFPLWDNVHTLNIGSLKVKRDLSEDTSRLDLCYSRRSRHP
jgi:hypothetical protein